MKSTCSRPALLILTFTGLTSLLYAQEKPVELVPAPVAPSTSVTEERTTTAVLPDPNLDKMEGKIQRMDGTKKQLMLRTKNGKEPIPYNINPATKIIDLDGKPVSITLLIEEVPVEVRYVEDGNTLIASTVIVQRIQAPLPGGGTTLTTRETLKPGGKIVEETVKTTVVTRSGTLRAMEAGVMTLTAEGEAAPVRYQYSETTTWVNAKGEPVPVTLLKAGYPVKVNYSTRGNDLIAEQVVILAPPAVPAPSPVPAAK